MRVPVDRQDRLRIGGLRVEGAMLLWRGGAAMGTFESESSRYARARARV